VRKNTASCGKRWIFLSANFTWVRVRCSVPLKWKFYFIMRKKACTEINLIVLVHNEGIWLITELVRCQCRLKFDEVFFSAFVFFFNYSCVSLETHFLKNYVIFPKYKEKVRRKNDNEYIWKKICVKKRKNNGIRMAWHQDGFELSCGLAFLKGWVLELCNGI